MGGFTQRAWTPTKRRGPIAAEYASPGPACVTLPTLIGVKNVPMSNLGRSPAFSFGVKSTFKNETASPGPVYDVTGLNAKGKDNPPSVSLHIRPKDVKSFNTPAPCDYTPEKSEKALEMSPKYSFGIRTSTTVGSDSPAPNTYTIPSVVGSSKEGDKRAAPSYTISGRHKLQTDDRIKTPGPGTYNDFVADKVIKQRSPAYTISTRYDVPSDKSVGPGPGAHAPEKVTLDYPPAHTFGIRHSPYSYHF